MADVGRVIWITGLSGAGKTTLAKALLPHLPPPSALLDGDEMREVLGLLAGGYGREDRLKLALTYARWCGLLAGQGQTVVCATISMFHEVHAWNRENLPGYFEIFIDCPERLRLERDYKSVYHPEKTTPVMGAAIAPEFPLNPDLRLEGSSALEESVSLILKNFPPGRRGRSMD